MLPRLALPLALLALLPIALAGPVSNLDAPGDVAMRVGASQSGWTLSALVPMTQCHDARVDILSVDVVSDDARVTFTMLFADGDAPTCETPMATVELEGVRTASVRLGYWQDDAWLAISDTGSGCFMFGEFLTPEPDTISEQFQDACVRSETPDSITYTIPTIVDVTSAAEPDVIDLRTLNFGPGWGNAWDKAALHGGPGYVEFWDNVPLEGSI